MILNVRKAFFVFQPIARRKVHQSYSNFITYASVRPSRLSQKSTIDLTYTQQEPSVKYYIYQMKQKLLGLMHHTREISVCTTKDKRYSDNIITMDRVIKWMSQYVCCCVSMPLRFELTKQ